MDNKNRQPRVILHIDMNSFYASVEMADYPELQGKPLAIAGNPEERKGVIVTSSYEARKYGVKTTMLVGEARKLCPSLLIRRPNFDRYREVSKQLFAILREVTELVQPVSIDEGYMDISDLADRHPPELAEELQKRIFADLKVPCSIGIAPNKFLAKMASDMKKPMGCTILRKRDIPKKLWPLPVRDMHGVGEKTAEKLKKIDVRTIGDLANRKEYELKNLLGVNGSKLHQRANGFDEREVDPEAIHSFKSIGASTTLAEDTAEETEVYRTFRELAEKVEGRMKRKEVVGQQLQIMIRYNNRKTVTRTRLLHNNTNSREIISREAVDLFEEHWTQQPIRLLGITMSELVETNEAVEQLNLFTYERVAEKEPLYKTIEELKEKYGSDVFKSSKMPLPSIRTSFQKDFLDGD
ncbi:DNA polymerase IV [Salimicrobium salexigens]|uniref:DNA polymerase IV n=1 Tax=Salimicrobium salexigens TaxID=908941 RepID=A0ABY1KP81_9BACI|nr:DNA polymerase IV [Salimicrobium salexigens]SIS54810.1 DNA polymerase-4 [Salimicrobium salexigens]